MYTSGERDSFVNNCVDWTNIFSIAVRKNVLIYSFKVQNCFKTIVDHYFIENIY